MTSPAQLAEESHRWRVIYRGGEELNEDDLCPEISAVAGEDQVHSFKCIDVERAIRIELIEQATGDVVSFSNCGGPGEEPIFFRRRAVTVDFQANDTLWDRGETWHGMRRMSAGQTEHEEFTRLRPGRAPEHRDNSRSDPD